MSFVKLVLSYSHVIKSRNTDLSKLCSVNWVCELDQDNVIPTIPKFNYHHKVLPASNLYPFLLAVDTALVALAGNDDSLDQLDYGILSFHLTPR